MKKSSIIIVIVVFFSSIINAQKIFEITGAKVSFGKDMECSGDVKFIVNGPLQEENLNSKTFELMGGSFVNGKSIKSWQDPGPVDEVNSNFSPGNAIFGRENGKMILIPYEKILDSRKLDWGFQNGRMLLLQGSSQFRNQNSPNKNYRSGIGFKEDGTIVVVIFDKEMVNYYKLVQTFVSAGCSNAIYLDGSSLWVGYDTPYIPTQGMKDTGWKIIFSGGIVKEIK